MSTMTEVAERYAIKDGQIDWDSLPDLLKLEYTQTVKMVFEAAAELGAEGEQ